MPDTPTHRRGPGPVQQQRSAETRQAVIDATVGLLRDGGIDAATAAAISDRSGVSWGGIQHQFGNKEAVLDATLAWLIADLARGWELPDPLPSGLEDRAAALVDLAWHTVRRPSYGPMLTLLRRRAASAATIDADVLRLRGGVSGTARRLFGDLDLDQATIDTVDAFCFAAVGGIADQQHLAPISAELTERSLAMVAGAIVATIRES